MKLSNIIFLVVFFLSPFLSAQSVYVLKAKGAGVTETDLAAITQLVESSVTAVDGFSLLDNRWKADFELRPSLTKLGSAYILTVYKSKNKKTLYSEKMKASTIEDMDTVVTRVVRAVLLEEKANSNSKANEVTQEEQIRSQRRYQAQPQWSYGIGLGSASNLNISSSKTILSLGRIWNIDPNFDLGLDWVGMIDGGSYNNLSMDLHYYLSNNKNAWNILGGVGYALATVNDSGAFLPNDTATGFSLKVGIGRRFFRTSTVNFGVRLAHSMMTSKTSKTNKYASLTSLRLVIFY